MDKPYDIEVTVKSVKGACPFGNKVGNKIFFDGRRVNGEVCYSALLTILPRVHAMRYGIEYPWLEDKDVAHVACPDPVNAVVYEVRRVRG